MTVTDNDRIQTIQKRILGFDKRAERSSGDILAATFVDSAPLFDLLANRNHQVIYGRRGTGKTHALKYLQKHTEEAGDCAVYIDLRSVGSNGSIYSDGSKTLSERAGTLIRDVISGLLNGLYEVALSVIDSVPDPRQVTLRLDDLAAATSEVSITGSIEHEEVVESAGKKGVSIQAQAAISNASSVRADAKLENERSSARSDRRRVIGEEQIHINFGRLSSALQGLIAVIGSPRIWLLIDEWSEVPLELQPYLADLIRKTLLPEANITVKIAAIEHRSQFLMAHGRGSYTGIELGADVAADLNLDDFLVFDNNQQKSVEFFKNLLYKHYAASGPAISGVSGPDELIQATFTQGPVFEEFVRAVEGVPRDALNLATKVVTRAWGQKVEMNSVRAAARDWYNQDKASIVKDNAELSALLTRIIDEIIGERKARAFLFPANVRDDRIDSLFDARILHILKKNTSSHDEPGTRYDVYKIDYGCYVELINTSKSPLGLYEEEDGGFVEVPKDDHRSIRRAILRVE